MRHLWKPANHTALKPDRRFTVDHDHETGEGAGVAVSINAILHLELMDDDPERAGKGRPIYQDTQRSRMSLNQTRIIDSRHPNWLRTSTIGKNSG